jgi:hypothetical protein
LGKLLDVEGTGIFIPLNLQNLINFQPDKLSNSQTMKKIFQAILILILVSLNVLFAQTNDFYDDAETVKLPQLSIEITGEVANPGPVEFSSFPIRSVVVKETLLQNNEDTFTGAYRYDGYSLYDILNQTVLMKKNAAGFPPIIDLYVEVENAKGEKVVFSWGEIYYPIHRHEIIIATQVARIVPSKTKELWPLPAESKIVVAGDLLTERNISSPVKITVKSCAGNFVIKKGMKSLYAHAFTIQNGDSKLTKLNEVPKGLVTYNFPAVFYGRGTGIHSITPFNGVLLKEILASYFSVNAKDLRKGLITITGKDGYHAAFTLSEIMNRNDQAEFLLIPTAKDEDGGAFKVFPAADFFSDRAIKSVESIRYDIVE